METSRKQYWVQTAKLIGVVVGLLVAEVAYLMSVGGTEAEMVANSAGPDLIVGVLAIVAAVMLYKGYGFFRGWGGLIVAKVAIYVPLMLFMA